MKQTIIFCSFDRLRFYASWKSLRSAERIIIIDPEAITNAPIPRQPVEQFILKHFPQIEIEWVGNDQFPQEVFKVFTSLSGIVEKQIVEGIKKSPALTAIQVRHDHPAAMTGLKRAALFAIKETAYFKRIIELITKNNCRYTVIPNQHDPYNIFGQNDSLNRNFLVETLLWIKQLRGLFYLPAKLVKLCIPSAFRASSLASPEEFDAAVELVWKQTETTQNINTKNKWYKTRHTRWNSFFLENSNLPKIERLLYVYGEKHFDDSEKKMIEEYARSMGRTCVDGLTFRPTKVFFFREVLYGTLIRTFPLLITTLFYGPAHWRHMQASLIILGLALRWESFCQSYRPKTMLGFDDQTFSHIARTLAFEKNGLLNYGIHHSSVAGASLVPEMCYSHYHKLFSYGPIMEELLGEAWKQQEILNIGPLRADLIQEAEMNPARRKEFEKLYGGKINILAPPPAPYVWNVVDRQRDFFGTLLKLCQENDALRFIIRPRLSFSPAPEITALIDEGIRNGYFSIEMENFDTWELIAFVDLVVCTTSSMFQEAIHAHKHAMCFCFNRIDDAFIYRNREPAIIPTNGKELEYAIGYFLTNGIPPYKNQNALMRDVCAHNYGNVIRLISTALNKSPTPKIPA